MQAATVKRETAQTGRRVSLSAVTLIIIVTKTTETP